MSIVTVTQIAKKLGLAQSTVSRALNDSELISPKTRKLVQKTAAAMGYIANSGARYMRSGTSKIVGLVVPDIQNEFFSSAARSMASHCAANGFQFILGISEDDPEREERQIQAMRENRVAGLLLAATGKPTARAVELAAQIPVVQFLRANAKFGHMGVFADEYQGILDATRHLLELGHKSIAYIGPKRALSTGRSRLKGYQAALKAARIPLDNQLVHLGSAHPCTGLEGFTLIRSREPKPSAIVVASSQQMLGVLQGARQNRACIPNEISLVGYGDAQWFEACTPALTSVVLPIKSMCETATSMLFSQIETKQEKREAARVFPTSLTTRESTRLHGTTLVPLDGNCAG